MNLDNVTVALRPRSEWEAVDLGVRMVRRDAATIYATWFALTLPMAAAVITSMAFTAYGLLAMALYFWLEPVTDGPILHIISRKLFGESTTWRSALGKTPSLAKRNWIFWLSPWRLHFARSIALPVTQLEGLRGEARRKRAKVLNRRIFNFGTGVTVAYQHLVMCMYVGVMLITVALIPPTYQDSIGKDWLNLFTDESSAVSNIVGFVLVYVAQSALHPWFVGAGFGLYINCRTRLEAWDIEVSFRRLVQRRSGQLAAAAALAIVLSLPPVVPRALAQDEPDSQSAAEEPLADIVGYWEDSDIDEALDAAYEREELATREETTRWVSKNPDESDEETESTDEFGLAYGFALLIQYGLWIGVAILIVLLATSIKHWLPYLRFTRGEKANQQRIVLADGEISSDSLPDDIPAAAMAAWQRGDQRLALSLLFRGSVLAAVSKHGVRLPDSATEGDCLRAVVAQTGRDFAAYFDRVVDAWVRCAYGTLTPGDVQFSALCADWQISEGALA
ncbi:MAG: hypothetical protein AAGC71_12530 [Pseudomonadota bacterium]